MDLAFKEKSTRSSRTKSGAIGNT